MAVVIQNPKAPAAIVQINPATGNAYLGTGALPPTSPALSPVTVKNAQAPAGIVFVHPSTGAIYTL